MNDTYGTTFIQRGIRHLDMQQEYEFWSTLAQSQISHLD